MTFLEIDVTTSCNELLHLLHHGAMTFIHREVDGRVPIILILKIDVTSSSNEFHHHDSIPFCGHDVDQEASFGVVGQVNPFSV
jgi:hypothetical protein